MRSEASLRRTLDDYFATRTECDRINEEHTNVDRAYWANRDELVEHKKFLITIAGFADIEKMTLDTLDEYIVVLKNYNAARCSEMRLLEELEDCRTKQYNAMKKLRALENEIVRAHDKDESN